MTWSEIVNNLPEEQAGMLFKAISAKQTGVDYEIKDPTVAAVFAMISKKMDEDAQAYEESKRARAKAGKRGAGRRWGDLDDDNEAVNDSKAMASDGKAMANGSKAMANDSKAWQNMADTVTVTDTVTVSPTEIKREGRESDKRSSPSVRPIRHKHGIYKHVLLTDDQYAELVDTHGQQDTDAAIACVDRYCETYGKKYKNYKLVIEKWGYSAIKESGIKTQTTRAPVTGSPNRFHNFATRDYDMSALEKALIKN